MTMAVVTVSITLYCITEERKEGRKK
jgi:hypothetical protein